MSRFWTAEVAGATGCLRKPNGNTLAGPGRPPGTRSATPPRFCLNMGGLKQARGGVSHPVGEKRPNGFGIYDMHGNVCEWCSDLWDAGYYKKSPGVDPPGPLVAPFRLTAADLGKQRACRPVSVPKRGQAGVKASNRGFRLARCAIYVSRSSASRGGQFQHQSDDHRGQ